MNTLVVGATGATGRLLVEQLLHGGQNVKAVVRSVDRLPESVRSDPKLTVIDFELPTAAHVTIEVFNVLGRRVAVLADQTMTAGAYQTTWDGTDMGGQAVGSGVYFYRIKAGHWVETRSMALVK